jgi:pimeloyl-ACP methyl ester carboxylesterase
MENLRKYGNRPFSIAVLHGGPGAPGEMAPVARELSAVGGVLEPLQTAATLEGQVQELRSVLEKEGALPLTLIGFSWGAILGFIFTARYPSFAKKLILLGSGVYEDKYTVSITGTRLSRLNEEERVEVLSVVEDLDSAAPEDRNRLMARFGELILRADVYDPISRNTEALAFQYDINVSVSAQVEKLRISGELLKLGRRIKCPVVAIHGNYDPHPFEGVKEPLSRVLKDFRFILLEKCGHYLWLERNARDKFYNILKNEI